MASNNMRTSCSQFEMMVSFMEEHGDITKPTSEASGRLRQFQNWENLTNLLNSDGGGATKTVDRWKKVWSDFKNNTKKKAARLHKAAIGTGGGPAAYTKLTDLEHRVLQLVGVQCATGLPAVEAGLSQMPAASTPSPLASPLTQLDPQVILSCEPHTSEVTTTQPRVIVDTADHVLPWDVPGPSTQFGAIDSDNVEVEIITWNGSQSGPISSPPHAFEEVPVENPDTLIPTRPTTPPPIPRPTLSGQTPRRRSRVARALVSPRHSRGSRARASPRRRVRPAHTEQAAQHFLNSDVEWRNFRIRQHQDHMENKREASRIRTMELQGQREWQPLGTRALDMLEKIVNKFCNN